MEEVEKGEREIVGEKDSKKYSNYFFVFPALLKSQMHSFSRREENKEQSMGKSNFLGSFKNMLT